MERLRCNSVGIPGVDLVEGRPIENTGTHSLRC